MKLTSTSPEFLYQCFKRLNKRYTPFFKGLTEGEQLGLDLYKSDFQGIDVNNTGEDADLYRVINDILRSKTIDVPIHESIITFFIQNVRTRSSKPKNANREESIKNIIYYAVYSINTLDDLFHRTPRYTLWNIPVYRGIESDDSKINYCVNQEVIFPTYTSTSLDIGTAIQFQSCGYVPCCLFIFRMKHSIPVIPMDVYPYESAGYRRMEFELLFPRETKWKVIKRYTVYIPKGLTHCEYEASKKRIIVYELESTPYVFPSVITLEQ